MKIQRLRLCNFRSIKNGEVLFPGHTVLIGGNSIGKSTICDALDLLLGPDRMARYPPIDEHDFFNRQYLNDDDEPVLIELEVVLSNLTQEIQTRYHNNQEYWSTSANRLLDESDSVEDVDCDGVVPVLRIKFEGMYNIEEDEFKGETYFPNPPADDIAQRARVSRSAKRSFGFVYLRALRTGSRALSLERGSLLDIVLKLKDEDRTAMWEETLHTIEELKPPIDEIPQLRKVLDEIDARVSNFIPLSSQERSLRLYATALTRESLRWSVTLFGSSERSNTAVPYWRLGSGVINSMVFSLLTFIADLKPNVIFAMEEPEAAIPPHTQRRIVQFLQSRMDQSILTTHSPFVLEQFEPSSVVLLERGMDGTISGHPVEVTGIKAKTYKGNLRRVIAEAMLGNGVLCLEGISDAEVLLAASSVLETGKRSGHYTPLDLSGVTIVQCEGDSGILPYGEFFRSIGLKTYAIFDHHQDDTVRQEIHEKFDACWELKQTGIESLLTDETKIDVICDFLSTATDWQDYPSDPQHPKRFEYSPNAEEGEIRKLCNRVLKFRKGEGYARRLVETCSAQDLPELLVQALDYISSDLPNDLSKYKLDEEEAEPEGD